MQKIWQYNGRSIPYEFKSGGVKNMNARVRRDGTLYVSAPKGCSHACIHEFLARHAQPLLLAMDMRKSEQNASAASLQNGIKFPLFGTPCTLQLVPGSRRSVMQEGDTLLLTYRPGDTEKTNRTTLSAYLKNEAKNTISKICLEIYSEFYKDLFPYPEIRFRRMTARWGSCSRAGGFIILNTALVYAPPVAIAYVVAHEFTHMLHMDHSSRFYAELAARMPDYKTRRALLKNINLDTEKWI